MNLVSVSRVFFLVVLSSAALLACDGDQKTNAPDSVFESANPRTSGSGRNEFPSDGAGGATNGEDEGPDRVIEEADIVKVDGSKLYALSQYGGLSIIDISERDRLHLLGRHKIVATPFEMYVRGQIVLILYQGYGAYVFDEAADQERWVQTSQVVAVDVRDPEHPETLATFEVPGSISDSRLVGDVLYVASFEDGYCWGCRQNAPRTTIISLDVSKPQNPKKVSELSFDERTDVWSWHRSISVTDRRMYVSGPTWSDQGPVGSTIQVVDISNPAGELAEGASIQVAGQINNRWQMDEYDGVLRVISQPFAWNLDVPPSLQTFTVNSSDDITPLGEVTLTLPRPEQLQSARFDGERAYAITSERTDPLFTLDLSDPATPKQAGILEMPGWIYHMEPRGDRVLGLGFDQSSGGGALTVSLFDVADISSPKMLDRVNFGGEWAWMAEDQDRIHKAFNLMPDAGLILVPFSGYTSETGVGPYECWGKWQSGIQLIDWAEDKLTLRGVAPAKSQARRGFLYEARLFAMSDERIETFDIADRDAPASKTALTLAQNVTLTAAVGPNRVVRVGQNWWTGSTELDLVSLAQVTRATTDHRIELGAEAPATSCYGWQYLENVLVSRERANLIYRSYDWNPATGKEQQGTRIATVDLSSAEPKLLAENEIEFGAGSYYYPYGLIDRGSAQVALGDAVVIAETAVNYAATEPVIERSVLHIMSLKDAENPETKIVELPHGLGMTGLVASGTVVARSHYEASPEDSTSVRFYLDRVDVSHPDDPKVLPAINIPGSLLALDAAHGRAITVDYSAEVVDNITAAECYQNPNSRFESADSSYDWSSTPGRCTTLHFALDLIEIDEERARIVGRHEIPVGEQIGQLALGQDVLFLTLNDGYGWGYGYAVDGVVGSDCYGACGFDPEKSKLPVLSVAGLESGEFAVGRVEVAGGDYWSYSPIAAVGKRALLSSGWRGKLSVIDASDVEAPSVVSEADVAGYVQSLSIVGTTAIASLGMDGVQTIDLEQ